MSETSEETGIQTKQQMYIIHMQHNNKHLIKILHIEGDIDGPATQERRSRNGRFIKPTIMERISGTSPV